MGKLGLGWDNSVGINLAQSLILPGDEQTTTEFRVDNITIWHPCLAFTFTTFKLMLLAVNRLRWQQHNTFGKPTFFNAY